MLFIPIAVRYDIVRQRGRCTCRTSSRRVEIGCWSTKHRKSCYEYGLFREDMEEEKSERGWRNYHQAYLAPLELSHMTRRPCMHLLHPPIPSPPSLLLRSHIVSYNSHPTRKHTQPIQFILLSNYPGAFLLLKPLGQKPTDVALPTDLTTHKPAWPSF